MSLLSLTGFLRPTTMVKSYRVAKIYCSEIMIHRSETCQTSFPGFVITSDGNVWLFTWWSQGHEPRFFVCLDAHASCKGHISFFSCNTNTIFHSSTFETGKTCQNAFCLGMTWMNIFWVFGNANMVLEQSACLRLSLLLLLFFFFFHVRHHKTHGSFLSYLSLCLSLFNWLPEQMCMVWDIELGSEEITDTEPGMGAIFLAEIFAWHTYCRKGKRGHDALFYQFRSLRIHGAGFRKREPHSTKIPLVLCPLVGIPYIHYPRPLFLSPSQANSRVYSIFTGHAESQWRRGSPPTRVLFAI